MNIINRKFHAALDYLSGTLLLAAPWLMHFGSSSAATTVSVFAGVVVLMMSTMTDYEGGLAHHIPMFMHLNIDVLLGIFLALSPWLFGFSDEVYVPHLVIGLLSILAGLFTGRDSLTEGKKR